MAHSTKAPRLRVLARVLALAVLLAQPAPVQALFEDEVGQYEWMVQQVGEPTALAYSADAAADDKVFIASASGVVASMLLKDGTLQWRRVTSQGSMRILRAGTRALLSVTDRGLVQAWKASTGDLTWQREYPDRVVDLVIIGDGPKQNVMVVRESEVEVRTMAGKRIDEWSVPAGSASSRFLAAALADDGATLCALAAQKGGAGATSMQIDVASGKVQKQLDVPSKVAKVLERSPFIVVGTHLAFITDGTTVVHPLCGEGQDASFELKKVKTQGSAPFQLMPWQGTAGVFAATNGVTTAIFGLGAKGLKHLRTFEGVAVVGPVYSVHDDETGQPVSVAITGPEGTKIQLLDPASGNVEEGMNAEGYASTEHGPVRLLLMRELSSGEHRTVLCAADHSLAGIHGSKATGLRVAWVREEALAAINQGTFFARAHAPTSKSKVLESGLSALIPAITAQLSLFPLYAAELVKKPMQWASSLLLYVQGGQKHRPKPKLLPNAKVPTSAEELRGFGANKLIITATRAQKLFALEATTSEIVWQRYFSSGAELLGKPPPGCPSSTGNTPLGKCDLWIQLLPSPSAVYSELLVVTPAGQIMWINPITGAELHSEKVPGGGVQSVTSLPRDPRDTKPILPFLVVDTSHRVHVLPSSPKVQERQLQPFADKFFHYEVDRVAQAVQGFAMGQGGGGHQLQRLWNIELGSVGERIVAAASPMHREWEHVPVHIKGDATILYKYINANLLAVVSEDVASKGNVTSLNLYMLDTITGHILHQSRIQGGAGPVHLVLCDNWALMHYWNMKKSRFEITIVELFEAKADDGPWNILFGSSESNESKSAHHLEMPVPLQQTYIFPAGVTTLGVTATLKGITPRSVIMALTTDHLYRISKDVLNPRRPYPGAAGPGAKEDKGAVPTQFAPTKEEPLMPYAPLLPLRPTDVLTYYNAVGQVSGIVSSPTSLESTSLLFAYGLDLFFVPVQTAKAYDVLSPGFNYGMLYGSVTIVTTALVVTSYWSRYKILQDKWK